jgi:hypothetical protein
VLCVLAIATNVGRLMPHPWRCRYKGTVLTLWRDMPGSVAYYGMYELLKAELTPEGACAPDFSCSLRCITMPCRRVHPCEHLVQYRWISMNSVACSHPHGW